MFSEVDRKKWFEMSPTEAIKKQTHSDPLIATHRQAIKFW